MSAGHTRGGWQTRSDYLREDEHTIIGNVDGEYIDGCPHCTYDTIARCRDEYDEYLPNAASNARLIVAACNSYDRHFGPRAIEAAEADLLGRCLEALRECVDTITAHHQWHAAQTTPDAEFGFVPADEYADSSLYDRTVNALDRASSLLTPQRDFEPQAREVTR